MGKRDVKRGAAMDKSLREMMDAARSLPIPVSLLALIDSLDAQDDVAGDSRELRNRARR